MFSINGKKLDEFITRHTGTRTEDWPADRRFYDEDWDPREVGSESDVGELLRLCQGIGTEDAEDPVVITGPKGLELTYTYAADGDGGAYTFGVYMGGWYMTSHWEEQRKIVASDTTGAEALIGSIVDEAVSRGNELLEKLQEQGPSGEQLKEFVKGYVEAMLTVNTESGDTNATEGVNAHGREDKLAWDTTLEAIDECADFVRFNYLDLLTYATRLGPTGGSVWEYAGHDFALNRNSHGAGFWDRGLGNLGDLGDRLSKASKAYGEAHFIVGDNGTIDHI